MKQARNENENEAHQLIFSNFSLKTLLQNLRKPFNFVKLKKRIFKSKNLVNVIISLNEIRNIRRRPCGNVFPPMDTDLAKKYRSKSNLPFYIEPIAFSMLLFSFHIVFIYHINL